MLFLGRGGVGKTSLAAHLLLNYPDQWSFLSDDMAVISSKGYVWLNSLAIHVYPYNIQAFPPTLWPTVIGSTCLERLHWEARRRTKGITGVVRRISPSKLYRIKEYTAPIRTAIFVERWDEEFPKCSPLNHSAFVERATSVTLHELRALINALTEIASGVSTVITLSQFIKMIEAVYNAALSGCSLYQVMVPKDWNPTRLSAFIFHCLDGSN